MTSQHTGLLVHGCETDEVVFDGLGCGGVDVGLDGLHLWHEERKYFGNNFETVFWVEH